MKYNVRSGDYDPRRAIHLSRVPVDLRDEPPFLLVSRKTMDAKAGPLSKEFMHSVLAVCPAAERDQLKFTVRIDEDIRPGDAPRYTPSSWHTDYAHGFDNNRRLAVHSYAIVTAAPRTMFLRESDVELVDTRDRAFVTELAAAKLTPFQIEPWTLVCFNATELHTVVPWTGPAPVSRLFFRATFDPIRG